MRHTVVSQLLDQGATIDEIEDLTGDDPTTLYKHYRHKVRPIATVAAERWRADGYHFGYHPGFRPDLRQ